MHAACIRKGTEPTAGRKIGEPGHSGPGNHRRRKELDGGLGRHGKKDARKGDLEGGKKGYAKKGLQQNGENHLTPEPILGVKRPMLPL